MKALRVTLYVLAGLILVGLIAGGAAFYFTRGAVTAADEFFTTIAEAGPAAAYQKASSALRAVQDEAGFVAWAEDRGLRDYRTASWSSREIEGGKASLSGTLTLKDGARLPAKVTLTKDAGGAWRVVFLDIQPIGIAAQPGKPPLPPEAESMRLAKSAMGGLSEAVRKDDFAKFFSQTSQLFQSQSTADKVRSAYIQFIEKKIDLSEAAATNPIFSAPPAIGDHGELVLAGYFPARAQPWYFKFTYVYEHPSWKLIGFAVSSHPK